MWLRLLVGHCADVVKMVLNVGGLFASVVGTGVMEMMAEKVLMEACIDLLI